MYVYAHNSLRRISKKPLAMLDEDQGQERVRGGCCGCGPCSALLLPRSQAYLGL
jgi:hypothetical protein